MFEEIKGGEIHSKYNNIYTADKSKDKSEIKIKILLRNNNGLGDPIASYYSIVPVYHFLDSSVDLPINIGHGIGRTIDCQLKVFKILPNSRMNYNKYIYIKIKSDKLKDLLENKSTYNIGMEMIISMLVVSSI